MELLLCALGNIPKLLIVLETNGGVDQLRIPHSEISNIPIDKQPLPLLGRGAFASYRVREKLCLGNNREIVALFNSPEPPGGLPVIPKSVLPPKLGT